MSTPFLSFFIFLQFKSGAFCIPLFKPCRCRTDSICTRLRYQPVKLCLTFFPSVKVEQVPAYDAYGIAYRLTSDTQSPACSSPPSLMVPLDGLEPPTYCLLNNCSTR